MLKEVAIKQSYSEIEAKDAKFINSLYEQALQDGFFADKHFVRQSMINLNNCTLVLNSEGVTIKEFDYRDFLTHQLPFNYDSTARNLIFEKTITDEDQDQSLYKKILSNKAGVLNWIIAGAERVIRTEDIFVSAECQKFKAKFIKETDSAAMFLETRR